MTARRLVASHHYDPAPVDLYVCYGTFGPVDRHPCAKAHRALIAAGLRPKVIRTYGCYGTDRFFSGRRAIKGLTGNYTVPTLVLDDGTVIDESQNIIAWAAEQAAAGETTEGSRASRT